MSQQPTTRPNLFHFATSELSQDAILAWLLAWADPALRSTDEPLHQLAQQFVRSLLGKSDDFPITSVNILLQWNKVDVAAEVNEDYFLLIEDKTGTREHSDQLLRYIEAAEQAYNRPKKQREIIPIYFKLEEQSDLSQVTAAKYRHFTRAEMIDCLAGYFESPAEAGPNHILADYYQYICNLDTRINGYKSLPFKQWEAYTWQGFFSWLQEQLHPAGASDKAGFCGWGYVANPTGGFMGFWWSPFADSPFYLQLEEGKLTFRMGAGEAEDRAGLRRKYRDRLMELAPPKYALENYGRTGSTMGLAKMAGDYRVTKDGRVDLEGTLAVIQDMGGLLKNRLE